MSLVGPGLGFFTSPRGPKNGKLLTEPSRSWRIVCLPSRESVGDSMGFLSSWWLGAVGWLAFFFLGGGFNLNFYVLLVDEFDRDSSDDHCIKHQCIYISTLPETNRTTEKRWLGSYFSFGKASFQGQKLSFREDIYIYTYIFLYLNCGSFSSIGDIFAGLYGCVGVCFPPFNSVLFIFFNRLLEGSSQDL